MEKPEFLTAQLIVNAVVIALVIHVMLLTVAYLIYLERKISAYIQDRIGPNRVGLDFGLPALSFLKGMIGLGQPLADGLKFFLKEDYTPSKVDKVLFSLAPMISITPALMGFAVINWGGVWNVPDFTIPILGWHIEGGPVQVAGANIGVGIIYMLAVASLGVYGITLGGWASNNKYSFLGGLRATAQMISYEIPLGLALLSALLVYGTTMPDQIVRQQVSDGWMVLTQPLAAVIFFIAILAEANRAPFDNAEAENELVGGYHTEYSSMRFALFFLAEYAHMLTSGALFVLLFLGGYHLPGSSLPGLHLLSPEATTFAAALAKFLVFFTKVVLVICFQMVVRWTLPRVRYDQVMAVAWQVCIPLALAHVVVISVALYLDWRASWQLFVANVAVALVFTALQGRVGIPSTNKRLPLYGSRFSPMPGERVVTGPTDPIALEDRPVQSLHSR